jgi:hypothetical protein
MAATIIFMATSGYAYTSRPHIVLPRQYMRGEPLP